MFQPVVPVSGLPGWTFLNNTIERQSEVFNKSPTLTRDTDYFAQNIGAINTAEDLVSDRRLLRVALGAFGLQEDINSRALIQKILEEGTTATDALANKLADQRYKDFAEAFGFDGVLGPKTKNPGFAVEIIDKYRAQSFELAVGEQDQSLRLALNARRELSELALEDAAEDTKWLSIMGTKPLREVFETVLGLPSSFAQLDLDRQLEEFQDRASRQLGLDSLSDLADDDKLERLLERYLLRDQINLSGALSSQSVALTLLQSALPVQR